MFQSTSVIADGRISALGDAALGDAGFNPRPSFLTDESNQLQQRPCRPACFNPRPSLLTDESRSWRPSMLTSQTFQSTSVIADGRIRTTPAKSSCCTWFQSTSVIADGRIAAAAPHAPTAPTCFNPRPSLLTDESRQRWRTLQATHCFNPRPSLLTDESRERHCLPACIPVSIHVRHC